MKKLKYLILIMGLSLMSCKGDDGLALLSTLFNNRMIVILKGTFATDRPLDRSQINSNKLFVDADDQTTSLRHAVDTGCSHYSDANCIPSYSDLPIWIDIGELRLSSRSPYSDLTEIQSAEDSEKFWDTVSTERQVYCSIPYDIDFDNACIKTGGIVNFSEFTNGRGAVYPSRDVPSGMFVHSGIFVRSVATGWGLIGGVQNIGKFDNREITGTDVTANLQYDPGLDDLNIQLLPPQWFPLHHKVVFGQQQNIVLDYGEGNAVLEYRFNMLENMMVHTYFNTSKNLDQTIVAFSDWRKNHDDSVADLGYHMGGNVLARTRLFYPHLTSTMIIDGGAASTRHYYGIYEANEENQGDNLPYAATPVRNGSDNKLEYIMPADYIVQCRYDCNNDGYPELVLNSSSIVNIRQGPGEAGVSFPCGCGIDSAKVTENACVAHSGCY